MNENDKRVESILFLFKGKYNFFWWKKARVSPFGKMWWII